ncbi:MAG: VCBS repeat-containing protein [Planctomycetes bacterium]|nr:VCBS repeat-containing protein [Planctomycetota bacterium]
MFRRIAVCAVGHAVICSIASAQTKPLFPGFEPGSVMPTSPVRVLDWNGDGHLDALGPRGYSIAVGLGDGNGGFPNYKLSGSVATPTSIQIGDINSDGLPDVACVSWNQNYAATLLQTTGAGFGAPQTVGGLSTPEAVGIGFFNSDARPDMVVANSANNTIKVLIQQSNGTYIIFSSPASGGNNPYYLATGDFNADGKSDFVVLNIGSHTGASFTGTGTGTFSAPAVFPVNGEARGIQVADMNQDGVLDAIVTSQVGYGGNVIVRIGTGAGTFGNGFSYNTNDPAGWFQLYDYDHDGALDVFVAEKQYIEVLKNAGTGQLASAARHVAGGPVESFSLGDFDEDGHVDLIVQSNISNPAMFPGDGFGGFFTQKELLTNAPVSGSLMPLLAYDFNLDGWRDLASGTPDGLSAAIFFNNKNGGFAQVGAVTTGAGVLTLGSGDFDGDGIPDLVAGSNISNTVQFVFGDGAGNFNFPAVYALAGPVSAIAVGDVDGDGVLDAIAVSYFGGIIQYLQGIAGTVGQFNSPQTININYPSGLALGDFAENGFPDIAVTGGGLTSTSLNIYINAGGVFTVPPLSTALGNYIDAFAVSDFNEDGHLDAIVSRGETSLNDGVLLLGTGTGAFGAPKPVFTSGYPNGYSVADVNQDGHADIAALFGNAGDIKIALGSGLGAFPKIYNYAAADGDGNLWNCVFADFNHDGRVDAAFAGSNSKISLLYQRPCPLSAATYGAGTEGCSGANVLCANAPPKINSPGFQFQSLHAPPSSLGIVLIVNAADAAGSDPFGLGFELLLDLANATEIIAIDMPTDAAGAGAAAAPIPNDPTLIGKFYYAQAIFYWSPSVCPYLPAGFTSTNGCVLKILQ